jgi:hypothetical protein
MRQLSAPQRAGFSRLDRRRRIQCAGGAGVVAVLALGGAGGQDQRPGPAAPPLPHEMRRGAHAIAAGSPVTRLNTGSRTSTSNVHLGVFVNGPNPHNVFPVAPTGILHSTARGPARSAAGPASHERPPSPSGAPPTWAATRLGRRLRGPYPAVEGRRARARAREVEACRTRSRAAPVGLGAARPRRARAC